MSTHDDADAPQLSLSPSSDDVHITNSIPFINSDAVNEYEQRPLATEWAAALLHAAKWLRTPFTPIGAAQQQLTPGVTETKVIRAIPHRTAQTNSESTHTTELSAVTDACAYHRERMSMALEYGISSLAWCRWSHGHGMEGAAHQWAQTASSFSGEHQGLRSWRPCRVAEGHRQSDRQSVCWMDSIAVLFPFTTSA